MSGFNRYCSVCAISHASQYLAPFPMLGVNIVRCVVGEQNKRNMLRRAVDVHLWICACEK